MKQEIKILANYQTNERMLILVDVGERGVLERVNQEHGGNWVFVNRFKQGDVLKFICAEPYLGFDGRKDDNYCKGVLTIK